MRDGLHFWTLAETADIEKWDPDEEPWRFLSGYGHGFAELFARLRAAGANVSLGRTPPRGTRTIVASLEELTRWQPTVLPLPTLGLALAALRCRSVVVIRGDMSLDIPMPAFISLEMMPNVDAIEDGSRQIHLPFLPQRGLIARCPRRGDRVDVVALKAYSFNIPDWLVRPSFCDQITALGLQLRIDTELDEPNRWPDFADVDVALCVQPTSVEDADRAYRRKPATKLINAWCAGSIPIVSPERPYLEIIRPDDDALVASTPHDLLRELERLRTDRNLVRRLRAGGTEAAAGYCVDQLTEAWHRLLLAAPAAPRRAAVAAITRTAPGVVRRRLARHLHR